MPASNRPCPGLEGPGFPAPMPLGWEHLGQLAARAEADPEPEGPGCMVPPCLAQARLLWARLILALGGRWRSRTARGAKLGSPARGNRGDRGRLAGRGRPRSGALGLLNALGLAACSLARRPGLAFPCPRVSAQHGSPWGRVQGQVILVLLCCGLGGWLPRAQLAAAPGPAGFPAGSGAGLWGHIAHRTTCTYMIHYDHVG